MFPAEMAKPGHDWSALDHAGRGQNDTGPLVSDLLTLFFAAIDVVELLHQEGVFIVVEDAVL